MKAFQKSLNSLASISLILLMIAGCQAYKNQPETLPATAPESSGLSPYEIATLNSLEQVSEYPLYTMHYAGVYEQFLGTRSVQGASAAWGCSLFTAQGDKNQQLYGRNFDFPYSPALLLFTDPPDGFASVSMVDLAYLGFDKNSGNLAEVPLTQRKALLEAPAWPFDGMNENGLVIALAAVPESKLPHDSHKPTIGSLAIIREILDHARTTDEAVAILDGYNLDFSGGSYLHYLIADRGQKSVLVEFFDGKMVTIPNESPWHLATNHLRASAQGDGGCNRYARIRQQLTSNSGILTYPEAIQLLADVSQTGSNSTQWSVIYGISTGEIEVVMGREYDKRYNTQLP